MHAHTQLHLALFSKLADPKGVHGAAHKWHCDEHTQECEVA